MLDDLSGDEWHELIAFYELDPFGEQRADVRHAHLMTLLARVNGDKSATPERFLPFPIETDRGFKPVKADEVKRRLKATFGGNRGVQRR